MSSFPIFVGKICNLQISTAFRYLNWRRNLRQPFSLLPHHYHVRPASIIANGRQLSFEHPQTILQVCETHGVQIPADCRKGTCGKCKALVKIENEHFEVLTCQELAVNGLMVETAPENETATIEAPAMLADNVIKVLEHQVNQVSELPGDSFTLQQDIDGQVHKIVKQMLRKEGREGKNFKKIFNCAPNVHLDGMGFNDFEILVVARMARFKARNNLEFLDLNKNRIGDMGCEHIVKHVLRYGSLRTLFLSANGIGDDGAIAIAQEVARSKSIKILELRNNMIGDRGAEALANAMRRNKSLTTLFLTGNQITDKGATQLVTAMPLDDDRNLKLWLGQNKLSEDLKDYLKQTVGMSVKTK